MSNHIKSNIADSILYNLGLIKAGGSITLFDANLYTFKHSLLDITDSPKDYENFTEYPACNILYGKDRCDNQRNGILQVTGQNRQILENVFELYIHAFGISETPRQWCDDMLADIQAVFGTNYQLQGSDGKDTAFTSVYAESEPFILKTTKPNCAIEVTYEVRYRQRREDPTEKVNTPS